MNMDPYFPNICNFNSFLRIFKVLVFLLFYFSLSCTVLKPFEANNNLETNYELGKLFLSMSDEAESFFNITPQVGENKLIVFSIDAKTVFKGEEKNYSSVKINLHGESSLSHLRKSYELRFKSQDHFYNYPDVLSEFFIISMEEDTGYINNFIGCSILKKANLFFSHFEYIKVYINGLYEGLYLLVEKPQDAISKRIHPTVAVYRRDKGDKFSQRYFNDYYDEYQDLIQKKLFTLYPTFEKYTGDSLLREIEKIYDFNGYCQWLAINMVLKNGDYYDEIYVYAVPQNSDFIFKVAGWDYEDIIKPPHGNVGIPDKLLYCGEDKIDRKIADEPLLYDIYIKNLKMILRDVINPHNLFEVKAELESVLIPQLYDKSTIEIMDDYSDNPEIAPKMLQEFIDCRFNHILFHRDSILSVLQ